MKQDLIINRLSSVVCHLSSVVCHLSSIVRLLSSALYICREPSTNQLLFMQNKPNFRKAKMNVNSLITIDYEKISDWTLGENKPNSNPIQTQSKPVLSAVEWANFRKSKMNLKSLAGKSGHTPLDWGCRKIVAISMSF
ncbi:MAG: hypothetical protein ABIL62_01430 [Planctomycetota bacterium]